MNELLELAHKAIDEGRLEELDALVQASPNLLSEKDERGQNLLFYCLDWPGGKPLAAGSVGLLLNHGMDPNERFRGDGETLLHWAASLRHDSGSIPVLLQAGADINNSGGVVGGGTPLQNAVHFGMTEAALTLWKAGAWSDSLSLAAGTGQLDKMSAYLNGDTLSAQAAARLPETELGTDIKLGDSQELLGEALGCAIFCEQYHCADWLLKIGAEVNRIGPNADSTLLHQVARRGTLSMAQYLVKRGADLNKLGTAHPVAPFHYALAHSNFETMNYLIDAGSETTPKVAASCGRLDRLMDLDLEAVEPLEIVLETVGTKTVLGRAIPDGLAKTRQAVARFFLQKSPGLLAPLRERALTLRDTAFLNFLNDF